MKRLSLSNKKPCRIRFISSSPRSIMPSRIPLDSNNLGRISAVSYRNPFSRIPIVGYDRNCIQPDRIPARFCRITTKSDVIRVGIRLKGLLDLGRHHLQLILVDFQVHRYLNILHWICWCCTVEYSRRLWLLHQRVSIVNCLLVHYILLHNVINTRILFHLFDRRSK